MGSLFTAVSSRGKDAVNRDFCVFRPSVLPDCSPPFTPFSFSLLLLFSERLPDNQGWRGTEMTVCVSGNWPTYKSRILQVCAVLYRHNKSAKIYTHPTDQINPHFSTYIFRGRSIPEVYDAHDLHVCRIHGIRLSWISFSILRPSPSPRLLAPLPPPPTLRLLSDPSTPSLLRILFFFPLSPECYTVFSCDLYATALARIFIGWGLCDTALAQRNIMANTGQL